MGRVPQVPADGDGKPHAAQGEGVETIALAVLGPRTGSFQPVLTRRYKSTVWPWASRTMLLL